MIRAPPSRGRMPRHPRPQSSGRSQRGRAAAPALPRLWGSQIQTVVPVVSERRLLGAEGDESWTGLQDLRGLASPFQAREHAWTHRAAGMRRLHLELAPPQLWGLRAAGRGGWRDPAAPSVRQSREPRSKR